MHSLMRYGELTEIQMNLFLSRLELRKRFYELDHFTYRICGQNKTNNLIES